MLYGAKIRTIEELAGCNAKEIKKKVNLDTRNLGEGMGCPIKKRGERLGSYSEQQIRGYINKAQEYMGIDKSNFVTKLEMDKDLAFKLQYIANIKTIKDLATCNPKEVHEKICYCKKEAEELAKSKDIAIKKAYEELCGYSEEDIKDYKNKAETN